MKEFKHGKTTLLNCDCMEYMAGLEDNAFDLAVVDPPYGIGESGEKTATRFGSSKRWKNPKKKNYKAGGWDKKPCGKEYFVELKRVSKQQVIWGANHFIENMSKNSSCWLVWKKNGQNEAADFADCELAWTSFKTAVRFFDFAWTGFGAVNAGEKRIHPTQKPVALYKWIFKNYAKPGQRILDTHGGSFSSAIAAHYFGCDFVGCELDKDYYDEAVERFNKETRQIDMIGYMEGTL